ncbi:hypothetical protein MMC21_004528 [Puttea exsequens]|nr:hypothetical protein [Puttea exsequens]
MRRNDPRLRQTLNQISQNLESANLRTQASLFTFSEKYISPCLSSTSSCLEASCQPCFAAVAKRRDDYHTRRPHRRQTRGREALAFDFYDDWEQDEAEWGNDELDRLLSGNEPHQPGKQGGMSYGGLGRGRTLTKDRGEEDPNILPQSSLFGFLERLPWKIGGRGTRYRPGVADLQENVGRRGAEVEPLMGNEDEQGRHGRNRSGTVGSSHTTNSLSSRGDLFPSDDEDDAVPLDDEFAMVLERRTTTTSDGNSSRTKGGKRPAGSRKSTKSGSSKETGSRRRGRRDTSASSARSLELVEAVEENAPNIADMKNDEERLRLEDEAQVQERREAARRLALERGLDSLADEPYNKGVANVKETVVPPLNGEEPRAQSLDDRPSEQDSLRNEESDHKSKPPD